ncbi:MAG: hypothetical protein OXU61_13600 [Gammaproteobacteria bacterium]|nr:hypothetical protein [Gammaproteobacteria bacterium]
MRGPGVRIPPSPFSRRADGVAGRGQGGGRRATGARKRLVPERGFEKYAAVRF